MQKKKKWKKKNKRKKRATGKKKATIDQTSDMSGNEEKREGLDSPERTYHSR